MGDFVWTEESLRWMRDAAAMSDFHERLAARLASHLGRDMRVLELGCGTGALALALSPFVRSYTALDSSALALSALRDGPPNLRAVEADAFSYAPDERFDALILCYFARPDEFLSLSRLCSGQVLLLCGAERAAAYEAELTRSGREFICERFSLPFDQPLRSLAEAERYAAHYRRPLAEETGDPVFPYRDRILRDMTLIRYDGGGGPD